MADFLSAALRSLGRAWDTGGSEAATGGAKETRSDHTELAGAGTAAGSSAADASKLGTGTNPAAAAQVLGHWGVDAGVQSGKDPGASKTGPGTQSASSEPSQRAGTAETQDRAVDPRVVQSGGGCDAEPGDVISGYVIYPSEVRHGGSLAWRNNNPGNIRPGSFSESQGAYPGKSNHGFAIFPTYEQGFAAISALLRTSRYQSKTILQAMQTYAPASDNNDPDAYAASIRRLTGLETSRLVSSLSDAELGQMASAIQQVEGYTAGTTYSHDDPRLPAAVRRALCQGAETTAGQRSGPGG